MAVNTNANTNYAYLVMVDEKRNNNKYYEIKENSNGSVDVSYGRVGGKEINKHYEAWEKDFYSLYREKTNKGYEDVTSLHSTVQKGNSGVIEELSYKPVENEDTQELLELLINSSREFMKNNYTVSASEITQKMVDEAQRDIDNLNRIALDSSKANSLYHFNETLKELFTDVPRKMGKVADYLATTEKDFDKIITREQEMLDNVRGAIIQEVQKDAVQGKEITALEAHGLEIRPVTYAEEDQITTHLGRDYNGQEVEDRYVKGFVVENKATRKAYEDYKKDHNMSGKDVRLFYHGSKVENWYSIMKQGLSLNPEATVTGKMFGQGLYFAPESRKSLNYMDTKGSHWNNGQRDAGYCAVYAVALGKCYQPNYIFGSNFREKDLPQGTNSVFASKNNPHLHLRNDEYIVYNQAACTIKYLLEMTAPHPREKEYNLDRNVLRSRMQDGFDSLVKTATGTRAELALENCSHSVQAELSQKITNAYDIDRLYIDYNAKNDRISLEGVTAGGDSITLCPNLTRDDYAFLSREMKKAFAESEVQWKDHMKAIEGYPVGKEAVNKQGVIEQPADKKDKKQTIEKGE